MLSIEQIYALNSAKAGHNLLICGQAGTGKTYVVKRIVNDLKRSRSLALLCTTGIGCMQYADMGATTVHSFAGLKDGRHDVLTLENLVKYDDKYHKVRENVARCETLIVDEISMLSMKDFGQLELVCRICRNSKMLFGEIKETHRLSRKKFTQFSISKNCVVAEREQFPLCLGYGLTIHKSQGMTLENVVVHCNGIFEAGQLSVAIGRAVSSKGLCLIGYRRGLCIQPKPVITAFY
ncbi:uncharacterized protein LOC132758030, partial [Ruditapes philippinarum]|uniref:uncharacterized protein LOC132758030 n=1 Tax=Ruditapes philippinarum TaxID=129788 RepID=UPI00295B1CEA